MLFWQHKALVWLAGCWVGPRYTVVNKGLWYSLVIVLIKFHKLVAALRRGPAAVWMELHPVRLPAANQSPG